MQEYEDGVYFDLPEEDYHRIHALSASGIKNLLISPVDFWARSWMNPRNNNDEGDITDSDAKIIGSAYHKRVLEGREKFYSQYAPSFDGAYLPSSVDDLRTALKKYGQKTEGNSSDLVARCARLGISTYAAARADYMAQNEGKIFLSQDLIDSIEISAAMIEKNPVLCRCFQGGFPEVTVIWTENRVVISPEGSEKVFRMRFKARFDYLKSRALIDLKTFKNRAMKAVDRAVYTTMASYKYHIQAVFYLRAVEMAKKLAQWHGCTVEQRETICSTQEHEFYFVFQQKGIAPFARGYKFPKTTMFSVGNVQIDAGINIYIENLEKFGEEQWIDCSDIGTLDDEGFPVWATSDL